MLAKDVRVAQSQEAQELFCTLDTAAFEAIKACGTHDDPPYEGLPKEELIRCACYAECTKYGTVFVESPYAPLATPGSPKTECDLWLAKSKLWDETWIEIKRAWDWPGWNNKDQFKLWLSDVEKLAGAEAGQRAFVLVSLTDRAVGSCLDKQYDKVTQRLTSVCGMVFKAGEPRSTHWGSAQLVVQTRMWWWPGI